MTLPLAPVSILRLRDGANPGYPSAVTHERINRLTTNIREEHVYRDVHEYDVFRSTQPVIDVEVLPARHFVQRPSGTRVEVPEENLAVYAGINSMWSVSARSSYSMSAAPRSASGYFQNADAIPRKIAMAVGNVCCSFLLLLARITPAVLPLRFSLSVFARGC